MHPRLAIDKLPEDLAKDLIEIFRPHPDAYEFIIAYNEALQLVDDVVDNKSSNPEEILAAIENTKIVFTMPFFLRHSQQLTLVSILIANTWADSIVWEKEDGWKKVHGDVLRHGLYGMVYAVVLIIGGWAACRKISLKLREFTHNQHLNDICQYSVS